MVYTIFFGEIGGGLILFYPHYMIICGNKDVVGEVLSQWPALGVKKSSLRELIGCWFGYKWLISAKNNVKTI